MARALSGLTEPPKPVEDAPVEAPRKVEVSAEDFLGGSPQAAPDEFAEPDEVLEVFVHPENEMAVEVFRHCQTTVIGGMGVFHQGISAQEFKSACWGLGLRVKGERRAGLMGQVQFMGRLVASESNERQAQQQSKR